MTCGFAVKECHSNAEISIMSAASAPLPAPEGPGSVSGAPNLPAGFTDTFTSRYIDAGGLRQHAVGGGEGPPLLLVHGWPQTWYAWRLVMPGLARDSRWSCRTSPVAGRPTNPRTRMTLGPSPATWWR
jgi:hypothetical protein